MSPRVWLLLAATHVAGQTTPPGDDDWYTIPAQDCDLLRPYFRRVNAVVIAQSVVGGVGVLLCGWAVLHVYAYRRDVRSLPTRLVLGMLVANLVYAVTDTVPINLNRLSGPLCGSDVIGPRFTDIVSQCLPTAVMFQGVWMTTMYELVMVLLSTHALLTGSGNIPWRSERTLHVLCVGAGLAALLGYYYQCKHLQLSYAAIVATAGQKRHNVAPAEDDQLYQLEQDINGLPGLLWGWALGPTVLAALCWLYQRLLYRNVLREWDDADAQNRAVAETHMSVKLGLDPQADTRTKLLELKKEGYVAVVKPLEPYVVVIILFVIPQAISVSSACQAQTEDAYTQGYAGDEDTSLPCEGVASLVLAFRAPALTMVYMLGSGNRCTWAELLDAKGLLRRAGARTAGSCCGVRASMAGGVRFLGNEPDRAALMQPGGEGQPRSFGNADRDIVRMGSMASQNLTELDFAAADRLAAAEGHDDAATAPADSQIPYQRME